MALTRVGLQQLAEVRIAEAGALLAAGLWDGAYYLAGYAVECGLKACIMALVERTGVIFTDRKFVEKCWTHNLVDLTTLAELKDPLGKARAADPLLDRYWHTVRVWSEASRYQRPSETEARELVAAITDPTNGVLLWIRQHW